MFCDGEERPTTTTEATTTTTGTSTTTTVPTTTVTDGGGGGDKHGVKGKCYCLKAYCRGYAERNVVRVMKRVCGERCEDTWVILVIMMK